MEQLFLFVLGTAEKCKQEEVQVQILLQVDRDAAAYKPRWHMLEATTVRRRARVYLLPWRET